MGSWSSSNPWRGASCGAAPSLFGSVIGLIAGGVCFHAVALKNRLKWDDALEVWDVHGVGGSSALGLK